MPVAGAARFRGPWVAACAIALANVGVRAPRVAADSIWLDEAFAIHVAHLDPWSLLLASRRDTTPPLYYLLLAPVERIFGLSEAAVRWPSILATAATGALLFILARRRLGSFAAWFASALFLLSDVNLRYAREARPYALASFLCVASFALFLRALDRPSLRAWMYVAAVNSVMVFTHYGTVFAVMAQGLALLSPWRGWIAARRFTLCHVPVGAAFLAWVCPLLGNGIHHQMGWLQAPAAPHVWGVLSRLAVGLNGGPGLAFLAAGAGVAFVGARLRRRAIPGPFAATLLVWALAPVAFAVATSFFARCLHARYLLFVAPALTLLWAAAVAALAAGWPRLLGAALACLVVAWGFGGSTCTGEADWRAAAKLTRDRPAEIVVLSPSYEILSFAYYYDPAAFRDAVHTAARLSAAGLRVLDDGVDPRALDLGAARDLVVVARDARFAEALATPLATFGFASAERHDLRGLTVTRYARRPPSSP